MAGLNMKKELILKCLSKYNRYQLNLSEDDKKFLEEISVLFNCPMNKYDCPSCHFKRILTKIQEMKND